MKLSVILATNKLNKNLKSTIKQFSKGLTIDNDKAINDEFLELARWRVSSTDHFLQPTLECLAHQKFKDFEFIISHKYPEDAEDLVKEYQKDCDFPIKLVKEKHSIWHDLGPQYHTVANNKNTGFINSEGELILHIDDLSFFNDNLLQEVWDQWKDDNYVTGRTVRCIKYDPKVENYKKKIGPNKIEIAENGWVGQIKPLTNIEENPQIPMSMFWTCCASVSAEDLYKINGYDEVWDGSLAGIDMDAGTRLDYVSNYSRIASNNYLYEINDPNPKNMVRDDVMFRVLLREIHTKANSWKPKPFQMRRYKNWHLHNKGELDPNWDKMLDVPLYDIKRIRDEKS